MAIRLMISLIVNKLNYSQAYDMDKFVKLFFKKFGHNSENAEFLEETFKRIFSNYPAVLEKFNKVFAPIKKEIDDARELQMSSMYC